MTSPRFLLFVPAWMAERTIARALTSALAQDYPHFRVVCVVDASPDGTWTEAKRVLDARYGGDVLATAWNNVYVSPTPEDFGRHLPLIGRLTRDSAAMDDPRPVYRNVLLMNPQHLGVVGNTWNACHYFAEPNEIVVQLDGDDQLAHAGVLSTLAKVYADPDVWLTYGSYAHDEASRNPDGSDPRGLTNPIPADDHTRRAGWRSSHLRTWKAWLFRKIRREDLEHLGTWVDAAPDLATMWPMIEMAGPAHARYVDEILYLYNATNPLSESRAKPLQARAVGEWLRGQAPYVPLAGPSDEARREDDTQSSSANDDER